VRSTGFALLLNSFNFYNGALHEFYSLDLLNYHFIQKVGRLMRILFIYLFS
jgi:hypothetical protein